MSEAPVATTPDPIHPRRRFLLLLAKFAVAGLAFAYVLTRQSWSELSAAVQRITPASVALALVLQVVALLLSALRWRRLMQAYGAERVPPFIEQLRVFFVGNFYNTFLPGAVGGDVLRAVVMRRSFGDRGVTAGVAIVLIERAVGMLAVLAILAAAALTSDAPWVRALWPYALLGIAGMVLAMAALAQGERLAPHLPRRIGAVFRRLPPIQRPARMLAALVHSMLIQAIFVAYGHVLVSALYSPARWADSLCVIPIATLASFLPVSIAGAGPRDAVLVSLYALSGVPRALGVAVSLTMVGLTLAIATVGGLWQLWSRDAPSVSPR